MPPKQPEGASLLEDYVNHLIDSKLDGFETSIKEEDAKEIVEHLMPELEKVVSKIIIKHLRAIATYTLKELKEE
jgi:Zn-dependent M32 family carboxypeptidase